MFEVHTATERPRPSQRSSLRRTERGALLRGPPCVCVPGLTPAPSRSWCSESSSALMCNAVSLSRLLPCAGMCVPFAATLYLCVYTVCVYFVCILCVCVCVCVSE